MLATGDSKAAAVALALSGAGEVAIPSRATGAANAAAARPRRGDEAAPLNLAPPVRLRGYSRQPARAPARSGGVRDTLRTLHLVVDAANVVGLAARRLAARPRRAARRLAGSIVAALVSRPEDRVELGRLDHAGTRPTTAGSAYAVAAVQVHLVLEGAAGAVDDLPTHPLLDVVHVPADGDSAIVDLVGTLVGGPGRVLVVTADRALRARVHAVGAEVTGPGTFRAALPEPDRR